MKPMTPFDFWRVGFETWLAGRTKQIALREQFLSGMTAWAKGGEALSAGRAPASRAASGGGAPDRRAG
jgi:hypothetical protein